VLRYTIWVSLNSGSIARTFTCAGSNKTHVQQSTVTKTSQAKHLAHPTHTSPSSLRRSMRKAGKTRSLVQTPQHSSAIPRTSHHISQAYSSPINVNAVRPPACPDRRAAATRVWSLTGWGAAWLHGLYADVPEAVLRSKTMSLNIQREETSRRHW
jgi:hypothetical protein